MENRMSNAELAKVNAEIAKMMVEMHKISAETVKLNKETRWLGFKMVCGVVSAVAGLFGAATAFAAALIKFF